MDFFSLDIEGAEMKVLRTIPFHKVDIEIFLIEVTIMFELHFSKLNFCLLLKS